MGLSSLAYLWRRDQSELLNEMISSGIEAVLIKVAAMGMQAYYYFGKNIQALYSLVIINSVTKNNSHEPRISKLQK